MKKSSTCFVVFANLFAGSVFAGSMGPIVQQRDWAWVGSLSMGPVWDNGGSSQTLYLAPEIIKTYTANKSSRTLFDGEVFLGVQKGLYHSALQGQLGLAVAATSSAKLSGHIWDDADPQFDNYIYHYKIQHTHVAIKGKLLADKGYWVIPWVSGSVGVGFNNSTSFYNTPLIFEVLPNSNFRSHSKTAFSYTVGAGIQKALNAHWQVGVGYEFADWGKSRFGRAIDQTQNHFGLNHLYTNGVLFNLTFVA